MTLKSWNGEIIFVVDEPTSVLGRKYLSFLPSGYPNAIIEMTEVLMKYYGVYKVELAGLPSTWSWHCYDKTGEYQYFKYPYDNPNTEDFEKLIIMNLL